MYRQRRASPPLQTDGTAVNASWPRHARTTCSSMRPSTVAQVGNVGSARHLSARQSIRTPSGQDSATASSTSYPVITTALTAARKHRARTIFEPARTDYPGFESRLPLLIGAALDGRLEWTRLAQVSAEAPARILGRWPTKGALVVGADADIVLVDPAGETHLGPAHMSTDHSPFDGMHVAVGSSGSTGGATSWYVATTCSRPLGQVAGCPWRVPLHSSRDPQPGRRKARRDALRNVHSDKRWPGSPWSHPA